MRPAYAPLSRLWQSRPLLRTAWFCAVACVAAVSLAPSDSTAKHAMDALLVSDKLGHFVAYFVLVSLPILTESRRSAAWHAAGIVALGFALEFWQHRYAGRGFDGLDVAANVAGVLGALATGPWLRQMQAKGAGAHVDR